MTISCLPNRASGSLSAMVIQEEDCWGQLAETGHVPVGMEFASETLANNINSIESNLIRGDRMDSEPDQGNQRPGGDINGEAQPDGPWPIIIKSFLGGDVTTTGSGPYVHSMQGSVDLPEGLTIEKRFQYPDGTANWLRYLGSRTNEIEIQINSEGIITIRAGFVCKQEVDLETEDLDPMDSTPTYATDNKAFNSFNGAITLGGAAIATVTSLTLRGTNNIDPEQFAIDGDAYRADAPADRRQITGEMTLFFTQASYALYQAHIANETTSLILTLSRGTKSWVIRLPSMKLRVETPQTSGRGPLNLKATFTSFRDDDTGTNILWTITNADSQLSTAA